jgi:phosphoenolpyruvate synthase/pyruvate phosphate dikinase
MQNTSKIGITIPLDRARSVRSVGEKARAAGRLYTRGFDVPWGFVLSADAYRAHLWATDVRDSARDENPDCEALSDAIPDFPIDNNVLSALRRAYESLGENAVVAVRHSATDERVAGSTYSTVLGVRGMDDLALAIKQVWASLWNEDAVELRALDGLRAEPAMAVFVQVMVDSVVSGLASSVNPETGNPNEACVRSTWGIYSAASDADTFTASLDNFRTRTTHIAFKDTLTLLGAGGIEIGPAPRELVESPSLSHAEIVELAEAAVWAESALGERVQINWTNDGARFIILGAKPVGDCPQFFPVEGLSGAYGALFPEAVSPISRSLLRCAAGVSLKLCNGRVYRSTAKGLHPAQNLKHYERFRSDCERLTKSARHGLAAIENASAPALVSQLVAALEAAITSLRWMDAVAAGAESSRSALWDLLDMTGAEPSLASRLLFGCDQAGERLGRDFQRLASYVWQESNDPESAPAPDEIVERITRDYGFSFTSVRDPLDPAAWQNWVENPNQVIALAHAVSRGPQNDVELAAERSKSTAAEAETEARTLLASAAGRFRGKRLAKRFEKALAAARGWRSARGEWQQLHALVLAWLRGTMTELGAKYVDAGVLSSRDDLVYLEIEELKRLRVKMDEVETTALRRLIAARKHEEWVLGRLEAPQWLPESAAQPTATPSPFARVLTGRPVSGGQAAGPARLAETFEEALKLNPGEVLIAHDLPPAWAPLLGIAAGLILTSDDAQNASLARDYAVPCVTGICGLEKVIRCGTTVMVDGNAGVVEIVRA